MTSPDCIVPSVLWLVITLQDAGRLRKLPGGTRLISGKTSPCARTLRSSRSSRVAQENCREEQRKLLFAGCKRGDA